RWSCSPTGNFQRGVRRDAARASGGRAEGEIRQPAAAPLLPALPVHLQFPAAWIAQSVRGLHSLFPGCAYSADETFALPWMQAGRAYNDSAGYVKTRKSDRTVSRLISFVVFGFRSSWAFGNPVLSRPCALLVEDECGWLPDSGPGMWVSGTLPGWFWP